MLKTISHRMESVWRSIRNFPNRPRNSFVLGITFGVLLIAVLVKDIPDIIVGIILTIFIERVIGFGEELAVGIRKTHPLRKVLGTLVDDDGFIYLEPFYRDPTKPDEFRLLRRERDKPNPPYIAGTQYVYGHGDAIALSLVQQALQKSKIRKVKTFLSDSTETLEQWGHSSICIGAHNARTREVLNKFDDVGLRFGNNYRTIVKSDPVSAISNTDGIEFVPAVERTKHGDSTWIDYGIIVKVQDEFHSDKKTIIVLAGIGDQGTAGAAYFLLNHYAQLPYEKNTFSALIEVPSGYQSARIVEFDDATNTSIVK